MSHTSVLPVSEKQNPPCQNPRTKKTKTGMDVRNNHLINCGI